MMIDIEDIACNFSTKTLSPSFSPNVVAFTREKLLEWYGKERRKLPWRGDAVEGYPDPPPPSAYGTWVSEVMLQQTRVETVIAYWYAWMGAFPSVEALANASQDEVNAKWSGLGYYRRAKALREGALKIVAEHNGVVPCTKEKLLSIPGIGPYTAGAISSIAFGNDDAIVDGNVIRVFSRIQAIDRAPDASAASAEKIYWKLAQDIVDGVAQAGDLNQAIMELGATVCKPTGPLCESCPLQPVCRAYHLAQHHSVLNAVYPDIPDAVTYFPVKLPKKAPREVHLHVYALKRLDTEQWLFVRRPEVGLLAGQFELPSEKIEEAEGPCTRHEWEILQNSAISYFLRVYAMNVVCDESASSHSQNSENMYTINSLRVLESPLKHVFSHQVHNMHVVEFSVSPRQCVSAFTTCDGREANWMTLQELEAFGVTTGVKKVLKALSMREDGKKRKSTPTAKKESKKIAKIAGSKRIMDDFLNKKK